MFLKRHKNKEHELEQMNQSIGPLKMQEYAKDFDLSGNNWVINDTKFDHMTKINFKNTLRQIAMNQSFPLKGFGSFQNRASTSSVYESKMIHNLGYTFR